MSDWVLLSCRACSPCPAHSQQSPAPARSRWRCLDPGIESLPDVDRMIELTASIRWLSGKFGFSAAGLSLIVATRYQWKVGGMLRYASPASAIIGLAMQLIWIDSATAVHRIGGFALLVWLLVIGTMLFTGRIERHFETMVQRDRYVSTVT